MTFQQTVEQAPLDGFVRVEGGTFMMGSPLPEEEREDNETPHKVTVTSFYMGKYEVTQEEWVAVMGTNPSNFKGDNLPVEQVRWYDAIKYCNKRSVKEGLTPAYRGSGKGVTWNGNGYRLPTEAEWEYAARGGNLGDFLVYRYASNEDVVTWYNGNSGEKTHPVGTKQPNGLGIYDMSGSVYEWCWDWSGDYPSSPQTDPRGASSGSYRVARGGSFNGQNPRSVWRSYSTPSNRADNLGFRLVRSYL
jgi:formylglycine-generating enzyme required for sulfatase activity